MREREREGGGKNRSISLESITRESGGEQCAHSNLAAAISRTRGGSSSRVGFEEHLGTILASFHAGFERRTRTGDGRENARTSTQSVKHDLSYRCGRW